MDIGIIAAISENRVIGNDGKLPWNIPEDLKHFKELTTGCPIIMGRITYESIGKPLPERRNVVIASRDIAGNAEVVKSLDDALKLVDCSSCDRTYIIGGERLYNDALEVANFMEITEVHRSVAGDVYFPETDWGKWKEVGREKGDECSFVFYLRK